MKIIKFSGRQIDEIEQELFDAREKGKDIIHIEKGMYVYDRKPVYLSGIIRIEKIEYHGTERGKFRFLGRKIIETCSHSSQRFGDCVRFNEKYWRNIEEIFKDDFILIGYRALLRDKFNKIGKNIESDKTPIKTRFYVSD